ncbi:MAG: SRPBCC family protein [Propionibacteriaceae bacterium]|nr:SRPBCC family protein [Propionibacteriaceae bacterium]
MALVDLTESVHIDAPPEKVWLLVSDVAQHPRFAGPKSITKAIDFEGPLRVGARWIAHEKFGPQKFDAPSEVTQLDLGHEFGWVSFPPMKEANRGDGGRVLWRYVVEPDNGGTRLIHSMRVLQPRKGAGVLKAMYKVLSLPKKQREGILTSLQNVKMAAEQGAKID